MRATILLPPHNQNEGQSDESFGKFVLIWAVAEDSKSSCTFINLEFEMNQLQEARKPQDEP